MTLGNQKLEVFWGLIEWKTTDSEHLWYCDFEEGLRKSYERLGYRLEGLKAMLVQMRSSHCWFKTHDEECENDKHVFLF